MGTLLIRSLLTGTAIGLLAAVAATALDWHRNPAGLFHDESGTDWRIVWETAWSWFWPVTLAGALLTVLVLLFRRRRAASRVR